MAARLDRPGFSHKHKKSCLKRVFGVRLVPKNSMTNAPNHAGVPAHERIESGRFLLVQKPIEQLTVG